jgi:hypothetical protein
MDMEQQTIDLNTDTLSGDVRSAIMDRVRALQVGWGMMSERDQRTFTQEIDDTVRHLVREAVALIAADGMPVIRAKCTGVNHKKGGAIEAKMELKGDDEQRHELFDAVDSHVTIVVADHERYIGEQKPEPIDPDQPGLLDAAD